MRAEMTVVSGPHQGLRLQLRSYGPVLVGRGPEAGLSLPRDSKVSGRHCIVDVQDRFWEVQDLASSNGTFLNGLRVEAAPIHVGDRIRVGDSEIQIAACTDASTVQDPPAQLLSASAPQIPGIVVDALIGEGAMGLVYRVHREGSPRPYALKVLRPELRSQWKEREAFLREITGTQRLDHPHIVRLVHAGFCEDAPWFLLEHFDGTPLSTVVASGGALGLDDLFRVGDQVLDALSHIHARSWVHRDLNPTNVLVRWDDAGAFVKLIDFGLSRNVEVGSLGRITLSRAGGGTLPYAAPEQLMDCRNAGPAADLYSVAATMFFLATGRPLFHAARGGGLVLATLEQPPEKASTLNPTVPPGLDAWLARGLAKAPSDRFANAEEMRRALADLSPSGRVAAPVAQAPASTSAPPPTPAVPAEVAPPRERAGTRDAAVLLPMLSRILAAGLHVGRMADLALDLVIQATRAHRGVIAWKTGGGDLEVLSSRHIEEGDDPSADRDFSRSVLRKVLQKGSTLLLTDTSADQQTWTRGSVRSLGIVSVLCIPLLEGTEATGAIYLDSRSGDKLFCEEDEELLSAFAERLALSLRQAREFEATREESLTLRRQLDDSLARAATKYRYSDLVGASRPMREMFHLLDRIVDSEYPVIIEGESGTGKELVARAIHFNGRRKAKPFIAESCGAIPETVLESELFGHVRGAFTGADRDRPGLFQLADGGTLFLDEFEDIPNEMQKSLLRVLQEGEVRPVGARETRKVDVRVLVATNRKVDALVGDGIVREDLFYRLGVFRITLPPLRERREDIPLLAAHFVKAIAQDTGRPCEASPESLEALSRHPWPGNVRQLENCLKQAASVSDGRIEPHHLNLPPSAAAPIAKAGAAPLIDPSLSYEEAQRIWEREFLQAVLDAFGQDTAQAAKSLGIDRSTLYRRLRKAGVRTDPWKP